MNCCIRHIDRNEIYISDVTKSYGSQLVLDALSLAISKNEITALIGPNGCGKSTLLRILAGIELYGSGEIFGLNGAAGMMFQAYSQMLLPWSTARENIILPLRLKKHSAAEIQYALQELLQIFPLPFSLEQYPLQLSGGQQQLVALLQVLIQKPRLLLADEPTSALDYEMRLKLRHALRMFTRANNITTIFVSHDIEEAVKLADRVVVLSKQPTSVCSVMRTAEISSEQVVAAFSRVAL